MEDSPPYSDDEMRPSGVMRFVPGLPPMFHNVHALPALLEAFALAQGEYTPVVRDKLVVQKLRDKNTHQLTGATIKFLYAELKSILDATRPALTKHGLTFSQPLTTEEGNVCWINSILSHKDGAMIITRMIVPEAKSMPDFGGNITYIRRYAAGPALGVSAEDDADERPPGDDDEEFPPFRRDQEEDPQGKPARSVPARKSATTAGSKTGPNLTDGQVANLKKKLAALKLPDTDAQAFFERMNIDGISTALTLDQFPVLTKELDRMRDA